MRAVPGTIFLLVAMGGSGAALFIKDEEVRKMSILASTAASASLLALMWGFGANQWLFM